MTAKQMLNSENVNQVIASFNKDAEQWGSEFKESIVYGLYIDLYCEFKECPVHEKNHIPASTARIIKNYTEILASGIFSRPMVLAIIKKVCATANGKDLALDHRLMDMITA